MVQTFKSEAEARATFARLCRAFPVKAWRVTFHPPRMAGGIYHVAVSAR